MHLYSDADEERWFRSAWAEAGKKLDLGESCLRFRKVDELALDVLGAALLQVTAEAYVQRYEQQWEGQAAGRGARASSKSSRPATARKAAARPAAKQAVSKRAARK